MYCYLNEKFCLFCFPKKENVLFEADVAYIYKDQYPVSDGHCLIIPKRHIESIFYATDKEILQIFELIKYARKQILSDFNEVSGFNIGINSGVDAGQSIFHLHVHLIPRKKGDVRNAKGGVRGVIPHRMNY